MLTTKIIPPAIDMAAPMSLIMKPDFIVIYSLKEVYYAQDDIAMMHLHVNLVQV